MNKIDKQRLIELAEGGISPSEEEAKILEDNIELQQELEDLRMLFAGLRGMPEPEIDQVALESILPKVRAGIKDRRKAAPIFGLQLRPAYALSAAAALALIIIVGAFAIFGPSILGPPEEESAADARATAVVSEEPVQPDQLPEIDSDTATLLDEELAYETSGYSGNLIVEAGSIEGLDLLPELEEALLNNSVDIQFADSTVSLMQSASADEAVMDLLEQNLTPDRERYNKILKALGISEL